MRHHHADRVLASVTSGHEAARSKVAASWQRCYSKHKLDPTARRGVAPHDRARLSLQIESLGRLVKAAEPRLDDLYRMIGHTGRAIILTDSDGLVLQGRTRSADDGLFGDAGLVVGADWSEAAQGTNGIGTCLAEARALIIHRDQHYLPQNIGMSCIDAPVFGPEGALIGALDVSSARADESEGFNQLIGAMLTKVAAQIEVDLFRDTYAGQRLVMGASDETAPILLAVDRDDIVLGATRGARRHYALEPTGAIRPRPLRDLTGESAQGLEGAERAALIRALTRAEGNVSAAARDLGLGRATLYRRMARLGIEDGGKVSQD